jgi:hypothetical protein
MTETPKQAEARRRRWLTLGETVGVLALVISAASLWDSHQDRVQSRAGSAHEKAAPVAPLVLTASTNDEGRTLKLAATGNERVIQTQTIVFPKALDLGNVDTVGNPRIEADWFAGALRSAVGAARTKGRLPVGVITRYTDNGTDREDTAIYDIGHGWRTRLLQSDVPTLEGITLVAHGSKDLQKRLDARWLRSHPAKA